MEKHRNVQAWADCHIKINLHGYTLEAYDPIGQRRNAYPNETAIDTTRDANSLFTFYLRSNEKQIRESLGQVGFSICGEIVCIGLRQKSR